MPFFDDITRWLESLMFIRIKKACLLPRREILVQEKARGGRREQLYRVKV